MKFIWDIEKDKSNFQKHKVSFKDASYIFSDQFLLTLYDNAHSFDEERWISLGQKPGGQILVVIHTYRIIKNVEYVRIISARKASKRELRIYFERRQ
jgi:hypothetical protein